LLKSRVLTSMFIIYRSFTFSRLQLLLLSSFLLWQFIIEKNVLRVSVEHRNVQFK